MALTTEHFLTKGYKKFQDSFNNSDFGLQRTVYDGEGKKKYFLTVYAYDFSMYPLANKGMSFEYEVYLFAEDEDYKDGVNSFRVKGIVEEIEVFEKWIEHLYTTLKCVPDIHNN